MPFPLQKTLFFGSLLSLALSACAQSTQATSPSTFSEVTLPGTEVRELKSSNTGRDYAIYVRVPEGYETHPKKQYPVLYVLDGQWDFKLLDSILGGLHYDGFVPDMIIIGITYSGENPDYEALRAMDYSTASVRDLKGSGDAPKFFAFLKEELLPFVEENYQADPSQRVLMGSSFGGLFTLYALFTEPELFSGYVAASPAVSYANRAAFKQEAEYSKEHQNLPARLFVSVGELEQLAQPVENFAQILDERQYKGLVMEVRTIEGERHAGNKPEAFNRGLRFVFQK